MIDGKRTKKQQREYEVLLGLVDLFIQIGKPIGSNTLRDNGFKKLSSATIRNYFTNLESAGYLKQQHSSGGRLPSPSAFAAYTEHLLAKEGREELDEDVRLAIDSLSTFSKRDLNVFFQKATEMLSNLTGCAVFLSTPRFENDFITDVKLFALDSHRCLCVLLTDFGLIKTHTLYTESKLSSFSLRRIEHYFKAKFQHTLPPENLSTAEESIAESFYSEVMVRYLVDEASSQKKTDKDALEIAGFSRLLQHPEFADALTLSHGLSLLESRALCHKILDKTIREKKTICFVGDTLLDLLSTHSNCSVVTAPYLIHDKPVGAVALLGPLRMPYDKIIATLEHFTKTFSFVLSKNIKKFKLTYHTQKEEALLLENTREER